MKSRSSRANSGYIGQNRLSDDYGVISENKNYLRSNLTQWIRPANWLPLPSMTAGDQMFSGLLAVYPGDPLLTGPNASGNFVAFSVTGCTYTVDWGNGTTQSYSAGATAQYNFDFGSISAATTITGVEGLSGYRQTVITAYPTVAGTTFSGINMWGVYSQAGYTFSTLWASPWLDIKIAGSTITSFLFGRSPNVTFGPFPTRFIEQFEWVGTSGITNAAPIISGNFSGMFCPGNNPGSRLKSIKGTEWLSNNTIFTNMFYNCTSLKTIPLLNTQSGTNFTSMFQNCHSLETIPLLNTQSGLTFTSMFQNCYSLETIPLLNTQSGTMFQGMFSTCPSLKTIPLLNTQSGTNFTNMFQNCGSLKTIPLLNTQSGTNFQNMFGNCYSLKTIPLLNTQSGLTFTNMFFTCTSLETIPLLNTINGKNIQTMFNTCTSLQSIPLLNFSAATTIGTPFSGCSSLKQAATTAPASGTPWSVNDLNLSPAAINQVFANLPTGGAGRTCNITNNWGAVGCDRAGATAKGWTVQG